jgi:hypothetical protein
VEDRWDAFKTDLQDAEAWDRSTVVDELRGAMQNQNPKPTSSQIPESKPAVSGEDVSVASATGPHSTRLGSDILAAVYAVPPSSVADNRKLVDN